MLILKNISKSFGSKKIIDSLSVTIKRGEIAVFLGSSGVGKSTLLRLLNNLETMDYGSVTLDEKPLILSTVNKTHTIGMIFQHFNLFDHLTVLENITLPLEQTTETKKEKAHQRALKLLERYELLSKASCYPQQLSGGQKQRLALARTLSLQPQIVCMDEPTSALDPLLTRSVAQSIIDLAREGYIILIATHDTQLITMLDCTIYLMDHGTIVESCYSKQLRQDTDSCPKIAQFISGE